MASLKEKWNVSWGRFWMIILTFAAGGSLCGYCGRKLLAFTAMPQNFLYYVCYIVLITLIWPVCILLVSIPLGQFNFFANYLKRIIKKLGNKK